jgi:DnaD/phage-associated family protein
MADGGSGDQGIRESGKAAAHSSPPSPEFTGFPAGELRFTSVPDLLFAELLPIIDDLAELKVTLHVLWLRQRERRQLLTQAELAADETLARGLAVLGDDPEALLAEGLARAAARGSLLRATLESEAGAQEVYVLNSEGGRRALARVQGGEIGAVGAAVVDRPSVQPRPNIFELYEDNIGLLSPILADELRDAEATYPADWIEDAFRIAVANNVRKWRYIQAILESWATEGKDDGTTRRDTETKRRWYTDEEFKLYFEHGPGDE